MFCIVLIMRTREMTCVHVHMHNSVIHVHCSLHKKNMYVCVIVQHSRSTHITRHSSCFVFSTESIIDIPQIKLQQHIHTFLHGAIPHWASSTCLFTYMYIIIYQFTNVHTSPITVLVTYFVHCSNTKQMHTKRQFFLLKLVSAHKVTHAPRFTLYTYLFLWFFFLLPFSPRDAH